MKTILIACALTVLTVFGTSTNADARSHRSSNISISGYTSRGAPIYVERYIAGYDRYGRAIWAKRVIRPAYRPVYRPRYVAPCPPPRHYHPSPVYRGSRVSFSAHFGR